MRLAVECILKKRVLKNGHCSYQICNSSLMKQVHIREESAAHAHAPYTCTGHPPDWFNCRFTSHVSDVTFVSALLDILENETMDHLTDHFPIYSLLQKLEDKFPRLPAAKLKPTNKVISTLMFTCYCRSYWGYWVIYSLLYGIPRYIDFLPENIILIRKFYWSSNWVGN